MDPTTSEQVRAVWLKVHIGVGIPFPQTVGELSKLNVTRYRIDYVAETATAYIDPSGLADVSPLPNPGRRGQNRAGTKAGTVEWQPEILREAISKAQSGMPGYSYADDFMPEAIAAGVTDYTCYISGQRVAYHGKDGDQHVELFPGAKKED